MTDLEVINLIIFTATATMGTAVITYEGFANKHGLPAGMWFVGGLSWLQGFAWLALITSLASSWYFGAWWSALLTLFLAIILTRVLFKMLAAKVQILIAPGTLITLAVSAWWIWHLRVGAG